MLFTDGNISTLEELAAQDCGLMEVASTEGIDVSAKVELARAEMGIELAARGGGLDGVVVTPALKLWHAFRTLELVYRDAYHTRLNDRYKGKWEEYRRLGEWAAGKLFATGLEIVGDPLGRAEPPEVLSGPGTLPEGTYVATMAWVNGAGEEGAAADCVSLTVLPGSCLLVIPVGTRPNARGWNVYIGTSEDALYRQNGAPLAPGETWTQSAPPVTGGERPGSGQKPVSTRPLPRVLQRG